MSDTKKQIQEWQEKVRLSFGEESKLYQYLFETMENFYYRYLETSSSKDLKTQQLSPGVWGAIGIEKDMLNALKIKNPKVKPGLVDMAKSYPKAQNPEIHYSLLVEIKSLSSDKGHLILKSQIDWGFPEFSDKTKAHTVKCEFKYTDLTQFRKELALKLEEVCEIFT